MGKHFDNSQKLSGVTYYSLSPNELKPLKGMLNPGFMKIIRGFRENVFYIAPPFIAGYVVSVWAKNEYNRLKRKNPDDYKDEK